LATAGWREGMASQHPGVWRWRVELCGEAPGDQCHHQSHLPPPRTWRVNSPTPPPALCRLPQRWRLPRTPDREGWCRAARRDGRGVGDRATAGPPQPGPPLRGRAHRRSEREGTEESAPVPRPTGRPAVAEGPSGVGGRLATSSGQRGANRLRTSRKWGSSRLTGACNSSSSLSASAGLICSSGMPSSSSLSQIRISAVAWVPLVGG
jgi:hypothetical protein